MSRALPSSEFTRRQSLVVGGLSLFGLNSADLSALRAAAAERSANSSSDSTASRIAAQHRPHSCVFIFLFGGPSHIDLWDMKPDAPAEIRGEFQPVATNVPGIHLSEHLPRLARQMDKLCLLRSMTHRMNVHGPACSEIYTGREYFGPPVTDQATPQDWPSLASCVARYGMPQGGLPSSIVLPWYTQFVGQDKRIAGQTGGRMGEQFSPFLVQGDPTASSFGVEGLSLPSDVPLARFQQRKRLHAQLVRATNRVEGRTAGLSDSHYEQAFSTVEATGTADAFDLHREVPALRDRYGRTKFGQSLLAARRLVEAGVSLITVNWDDDSRFDKVSPHWDTHHQNFSKLREGLCPPFDQAFAMFLEDLHARGLLDSTLVVVSGEFGRSPRIGLITQNGMTEKTGRDHWPHAFTVLLAGGGVRGGQVYGATGSTGGFVTDNPVSPADLAATILLHLGVDSHREYDDQFQRMPQRLCEGLPIRGLG